MSTTTYVADVTTWKSMKHMFSAFSYETQERIRRLTAKARHMERVEAALQAAKAWVQESHYDDLELAAPALCYLETLGLCGGNHNNPGCGTQRHWAFRGLGKGRRKASDGGAWTAAIGAAARRHTHHVSLHAHPVLGVVVHTVGLSTETGEAQFKLIPLLGGAHVDDPEYKHGVAEMARNAVYALYHAHHLGHDNTTLLEAIAITLEEIQQYERG